MIGSTRSPLFAIALFLKSHHQAIVLSISANRNPQLVVESRRIEVSNEDSAIVLNLHRDRVLVHQSVVPVRN